MALSIQRTRFLLATLAVLALLAISTLVVQGVAIAQLEGPKGQSPEPAASQAVYPSCRFGAATLGQDQADWLDELGAGWHLSFGPTGGAASNFAEFVPSVKIKQDKKPDGTYLSTYTASPALTPSGLGALVDKRPGALWVVGNEVDRGPDPGQTEVNQGDTYPNVYARAYHDVYHFIKKRDPTAQVAISALVQVTPGRLQYLDRVWQAYRDQYRTVMPVDVWNMHLYILPEVNPQGQPNAIANVALGTDWSLGRKESYDPDGGGPLTPADTCSREDVYCFAEHDNMTVFAQQVVAMRTWMRDHGQRDKPLILSEFSILYPYIVDPGGTCFLQDENGRCFDSNRVITYLNNTFNYLESASDPGLGYPLDGNRLVQQSLWFSVNTYQVGYMSSLVKSDDSGLSPVGQAFRNAINSRAPTVNLFFDSVEGASVKSGTGGTATAMLRVAVRNNGNRAPASPIKVTFYSNSALTQAIGTATIAPPDASQPGMTGCARRAIAATVDWSGLTPGLHRYWVKVDSSSVISESNENDNVGTALVMVDAVPSYLPLTGH
jgi:hypothetical protein